MSGWPYINYECLYCDDIGGNPNGKIIDYWEWYDKALEIFEQQKKEKTLIKLTRVGHRYAEEIDEKRNNLILELVEERKCVKEIAEAIGTTPYRVSQRLRLLGVKTKRAINNERSSEITRDKILLMKNAGYTNKDIALHFGVYEKTVKTKRYSFGI